MKDKKTTQHRLNIESAIQASCVAWFRASYPAHERLLFSVPNGGFRYAITSARMVEEGMTAGVADLLLLWPSGRWHGMAIEFKAPGRKASEDQLTWGSAVMGAGYLYRVVWSRDEFKQLITDYMQGK